MRNEILLAESGGSKTDWIHVDSFGNAHNFSTKSSHPREWKLDFFQELKENLQKEAIDFSVTDFIFFGAGCNREEIQELLYLHLSSFGFKSIEINGDLLAAVRATIGFSDGYTAILGSGSVLIYSEKGKVVKYFGGLGPESGDEGSGYYFGKLILDDMRIKDLDSKQQIIIEQNLTTQEIAWIVKNEPSSTLCIDMSRRLAEFKREFMRYHIQNISDFHYQVLFDFLPKNQILHFVGSYAFFHKEIIQKYLAKEGIQTGVFVARPLEIIAKQYTSSI